jgi:PIN domain nuclease of toxin-antitoxin system
MNILLDTHTFIWWDSDLTKLSSKALGLCRDQTNTLLLSVASVWEMQIKYQLGKLTLKLPLVEIIETQQQTNNIEILPVHIKHVLALESLPSLHKDPFDRLLIAQANVEGALFLSCDPIFASYPVNVIW